MTQADLAFAARVSTRHLSFVETGRAAPSRDLVLALAEGLTMPLRDRNTLLLSAGYAPVFADQPLGAATLATARNLVRRVLHAHEPCPAVAIDRQWNLVAANRMVRPLIQGAAAHLLAPPVNLLRLTLHPEGLAPRIENLDEWRARMLARLRQQFAETGAVALEQLHAELSAYPGRLANAEADPAGFAAPLRLTSPVGPLALVSATMVFGTALDVEISELAIETFLPADDATRDALGRLAGGLNEIPEAWDGSARPYTDADLVGMSLL
jgi:transcriptional regulator with XRE-family HTH domain